MTNQQWTSQDVGILVNAGDGTFVADGFYGVGMKPVAMAIGDFDNAGNPDIAVVNFDSDTVSVLLSTCAASCLGDLDGSGEVGLSDLLEILRHWGPCPAGGEPCPADLEPPAGDGVVGLADLLRVLDSWGPCP